MDGFNFLFPVVGRCILFSTLGFEPKRVPLQLLLVDWIHSGLKLKSLVLDINQFVSGFLDFVVEVRLPNTILLHSIKLFWSTFSLEDISSRTRYIIYWYSNRNGPRDYESTSISWYKISIQNWRSMIWWYYHWPLAKHPSYKIQNPLIIPR